MPLARAVPSRSAPASASLAGSSRFGGAPERVHPERARVHPRVRPAAGLRLVRARRVVVPRGLHYLERALPARALLASCVYGSPRPADGRDGFARRAPEAAANGSRSAPQDRSVLSVLRRTDARSTRCRKRTGRLARRPHEVSGLVDSRTEACRRARDPPRPRSARSLVLFVSAHRRSATKEVGMRRRRTDGSRSTGCEISSALAPCAGPRPVVQSSRGGARLRRLEPR